MQQQQMYERGRWDPTSQEGEEHLLQAARGIVRNMDRTTTMTEETMRIFAEFDGRLTHERLHSSSPHHPSPSAAVPSGALGRNLRFLERQISRCLNSQRPIWSDTNETHDFLDAVDTLIGTIDGLDPMIPGDKRIQDFAADILDKSMFRLEYEFKYLMDVGSYGGSTPMIPVSSSSSNPLAPFNYEEEDDDAQIPVAQPLTDYNVVIDALPWGTISDLREIARRMLQAKYSKECADVYILSRRDFLEESVSRMGLLGWSAGEVHAAPWKDLESEFKRWTQGVKVAFRILFPSERRLCARVFAEVPPNLADLIFGEVCRVAVNQLLGFADAVASGNRSPERLFGIVDLYESLRDLLPEIDSVFSDSYSVFVSDESWHVLGTLGQAIRGIFTELENLIRRDSPNSTVAGGAVHPITRYVMNYLRAASASWQTLEEVLDEERGGPPSARGPIRSNSSLSARVGWIMSLLLANLDAKAAAYRDTSLSSFFLLNNGRYVVKKATDELSQILGENWVRGQVARVRQWQNTYHKSTWGKLLELLRLDDVGYGSSGDVLDTLRDKVGKFATQLESLHEVQSGWAAADEELREDLTRVALDAVLPAYISLLGRFRGSSREVMRQMDRWVKYGEADVQRMITELYQGPPKNS